MPLKSRLNRLEQIQESDLVPEATPVLFACKAEDMQQATALDRQGKRYVVIETVDCRRSNHANETT